MASNEATTRHSSYQNSSKFHIKDQQQASMKRKNPLLLSSNYKILKWQFFSIQIEYSLATLLWHRWRITQKIAKLRKSKCAPIEYRWRLHWFDRIWKGAWWHEGKGVNNPPVSFPRVKSFDFCFNSRIGPTWMNVCLWVVNFCTVLIRQQKSIALLLKLRTKSKLLDVLIWVFLTEILIRHCHF